MSNIIRFYYNWSTPKGIIENVKQIPKIARMIKQRATKGFCEWDTWNFDYFLGSIIPAALRKLKDEHVGYPMGFTPEEWEAHLEKIASLIEAGMVDSSDVNPFPYMTSEWIDAQEKLERKRRESLKEGFELLAQSFGDLWD